MCARAAVGPAGGPLFDIGIHTQTRYRGVRGANLNDASVAQVCWAIKAYGFFFSSFWLVGPSGAAGNVNTHKSHTIVTNMYQSVRAARARSCTTIDGRSRGTAVVL